MILAKRLQMSSWWVWVLLVLVGGVSGMISCPQHCSCFTRSHGFISANCSTMVLGASEPSSVDLLSLYQPFPGYSTNLEPHAFIAFQKVKYLSATNCSLPNLPLQVFDGLHYVIRIDLSHNKIKHLNGGVFKSLENLRILKLRGNPLELTPWDVVVSDSLHELDFGYCGIRTIPHGTFASLPRLTRLYLDGNELSSFVWNTLPAGLRYLNLARNGISNVPTEVLSTMSYLTRLDLSKNPINCTCNLLKMPDLFYGQRIIFDNGVLCSEPLQYAGFDLSKINENELCTHEEVKRLRRVNDNQNYQDSKTHKSQNMIQNRDFQLKQHSGRTFVKVRLYDKGTHNHTQMKGNDKYYAPFHSDIGGENKKVVTSKQESSITRVKIAFPKLMAKAWENKSSREKLSYYEEEAMKEHISQHEHNMNATSMHDKIPFHSKLSEVVHTINVSNEEHTSLMTSEDLSLNLNETKMTSCKEKADVGQNPVHNISEMMTELGEEGNGSEVLNITNSQLELHPSQEGSFTSLTSHHSGEATLTTELITRFMEDGSSDGENDTVITGNVPLDNETTVKYVSICCSSSMKHESSPSSIANVFSVLGGSTEIFSISTEPLVSSTKELPSTVERFIVDQETSPSQSEIPSSTAKTPRSSSSNDIFTVFSDKSEVEEVTSAISTVHLGEITISPSINPIFSTTSPAQVPNDKIEFLKNNSSEFNSNIILSPTKKELENEGEKEAIQSTMPYVIVGLIFFAILLNCAFLVCRNVKQMCPCSSKKKWCFSQDTEENQRTEMQDMRLLKSSESDSKTIIETAPENDSNLIDTLMPLVEVDEVAYPRPVNLPFRMEDFRYLIGPSTR